MAVVTSSTWASFSGQVLTGADLLSLGAICSEVNAAIKQLCRPWLFETTTITDQVLDAPLGDVLVLPQRPIQSITSLYVRDDANGDPSLFTSGYLLTNYTEYLLDKDDGILGISRTGLVKRRAGSWYGQSWGGERRMAPERLSSELVPGRGAVKITYVAGFVLVPEEVQLAANLAVSMLLSRRKFGMPVQSESWNGESYSLAAPFTAVGVLQSPDIAGLLSGYMAPFVGKA